MDLSTPPFVSLDDCLPPDLRGSDTTITPIAAGLSGAGVYRVEARGQTFVLKIAEEAHSPAGWDRKLHVQRLASGAGLCPRIVHVDASRRAVVSEFVVDRSFSALYFNPDTRQSAIEMLGRTVRRVHDLPLPPGPASDPVSFLRGIWSGLATGFALPEFVSEAVRGILAADPPASERAPVLSHNDVNPTNLVYDGERLMLLDWEASGPNDPYFDLGAASVFLRMDDAARRALLSAYLGVPVEAIPERFAYARRLAAIMSGTMFLHLARTLGHPGATGDETIDTTLSIAGIYQQLRSGALRIGSPEGQWAFGLALLKASTEP